MSGRGEVVVPGGRLEVAIDREAWPLDTLCAFGARRGSRRGFLVVSKVLGRHIPARPSTMRAAADDLAARLPPDLAGPVLVVGLAETAVCLGQSVHEAYIARTERGDVVYLHSTRQAADWPEFARFQEPHSHAPAHIVYEPADAAVAALALGARTLVLIDDEASTGTTFVNLAAALTPRLPKLKAIMTGVLTDWSGGDYVSRLPRPALAVSLLAGTLRWRPDEDRSPPDARASATAAGFGAAPAGVNFGRFGRCDPASEGDAMAAVVAPVAGRRILVLGSGEFTYPPFRVAEALERAGGDVLVQATTRSPVQVAGPIGCALTLRDDYGSGAPHFLYNQRRDPDRLTLVGHETPAGSLDPAFLAALGDAVPLCFGRSG